MSYTINIPQTDADAEEVFGEGYEDGPSAFALGEVPPAVQRTLDELGAWVGEHSDVTITVARDWEHCIFAVVEPAVFCDVVAVTDNGRVGHGGVNLPVYFDTVAEFRASFAQAA